MGGTAGGCYNRAMPQTKRQTIHLRLPVSMAEAVKATAEAEGATMNTYLVAVIASAIDWPAKHDQLEGPRDADTSEGQTTPERPDDARAD
jgi:hypothetical protein